MTEFVRGPQVTCAHCQTTMNAYTEADGQPNDPPVIGSIALCFTCGGINIHEAPDVLRAATEDEMERFSKTPAIVRARRMISYTDSPVLANSLLNTKE